MTDENTPHAGAPAKRGLSLSPRSSRVLALALAAIAVAAAVAIVLQLVLVRPQYMEAQAEQQARTEAVRSAERFTVEVNNFDAADLATLKERLSPLLTTKFRADFEATIDDILVQIEEAKLTSEGEVLRSAVASVDPDSAQVLVVADASADSVFGTRVRHFRWELDLVKVDGEWLVDNFTPVA